MESPPCKAIFLVATTLLVLLQIPFISELHLSCFLFICSSIACVRLEPRVRFSRSERLRTHISWAKETRPDREPCPMEEVAHKFRNRTGKNMLLFLSHVYTKNNLSKTIILKPCSVPRTKHCLKVSSYIWALELKC